MFEVNRIKQSMKTHSENDHSVEPEIYNLAFSTASERFAALLDDCSTLDDILLAWKTLFDGLKYPFSAQFKHPYLPNDEYTDDVTVVGYLDFDAIRGACFACITNKDSFTLYSKDVYARHSDSILDRVFCDFREWMHSGIMCLQSKAMGHEVDATMLHYELEAKRIDGANSILGNYDIFSSKCAVPKQSDTNFDIAKAAHYAETSQRMEYLFPYKSSALEDMQVWYEYVLSCAHFPFHASLKTWYSLANEQIVEMHLQVVDVSTDSSHGVHFQCHVQEAHVLPFDHSFYTSEHKDKKLRMSKSPALELEGAEIIVPANEIVPVDANKHTCQVLEDYRVFFVESMIAPADRIKNEWKQLRTDLEKAKHFVFHKSTSVS